MKATLTTMPPKALVSSVLISVVCAIMMTLTLKTIMSHVWLAQMMDGMPLIPIIVKPDQDAMMEPSMILTITRAMIALTIVPTVSMTLAMLGM